MKFSRSVLPLFLAAAVVSGAGSAFAAGSQSDQQSSGDSSYGQGYYGPMMGGYGHMGNGYGHMGGYDHMGGYGPMMGGYGHMGNGYGHMGGYGADMANGGPGYYGGQLSDAGQAKYDQIVSSYSEKFDKLNDELFVKNSELDAMQRAERPDPKEVRAKADEVVSVRRELRALSDEMNQKLEKEVFAPERKAAGQR